MTDSSGEDAPPKPEGRERFAYGRQLSPLLWAFVAITLIEMSAVHPLLWHWSRSVSLTLLALNLTVLVSLFALLFSFRSRPVEVDARSLRVRAGFLIDTHVPLSEIAYVQGGDAPADYMPGSLLKTSLLTHPNAMILLRRDIVLPGPFGRPRSVHAVALAIDEPARFLAAINQHLKGGERAAA